MTDSDLVAELEALVEEWREKFERQKTPEEWATFGKCADDLEEVLERHE